MSDTGAVFGLLVFLLTKDENSKWCMDESKPAFARLGTVVMCHCAQSDLNKEEDENGEAQLVVKVVEVVLGSLDAHGRDTEEEGNKDKEQGGELDPTVRWEPVEEGPAEASQQNGGGNQNEPCENHKDLSRKTAISLT